jgi:hypothetical protein
VVVVNVLENGRVAVLGVHPSELRDADPSGTALVKRLLTFGLPGPVAWLDFENTLVLRMDDPGGAQNVYSRNWCYPKLTEETWAEIGRLLAARNGRLSIGYTPAWVDDGDPSRGELTVNGERRVREAGAIYPAPVVQYLDIAGHSPGTFNDYVSEYEGIQALRHAGLLDVQVHGYTHIHPDRASWLEAPDRFETWPTTSWYRELGSAAAPLLEKLTPEEHPLTKALHLFAEYFGILPTTLICPGDQWEDAVLARALELGLSLVSSYYLAIEHEGRFCWTQHVCAPYLDCPDDSWFRSELPVVGYFHDYEVALEGTRWLCRWLDAWLNAGAQRLIGFDELAACLACSVAIENRGDRLNLKIHRSNSAAGYPIPVRIRFADNHVLARYVKLMQDQPTSAFEIQTTEPVVLGLDFDHIA